MAKTKSRSKVEDSVEEKAVEAPTHRVSADDRTAIDDVEAKKKRKRKEQLPDGYKKRLPGGVMREVRVIGSRIGKEGAKVCKVTDTTTGKSRTYDKVKIEGESELVHEITETVEGCRPNPTVTTTGKVSLRTEASILVGK